MTIKRLPPANNPLDVNLHVNVKLTPYFTKFYQAMKLPVDTPEAFLLREMKKVVIDFYTLNELREAKKAAREIYDAELQSISDDHVTIAGEVD